MSHTIYFETFISTSWLIFFNNILLISLNRFLWSFGCLLINLNNGRIILIRISYIFYRGNIILDFLFCSFWRFIFNNYIHRFDVHVKCKVRWNSFCFLFFLIRSYRIVIQLIVLIIFRLLKIRHRLLKIIIRFLKINICFILDRLRLRFPLINRRYTHLFRFNLWLLFN